MLQARRAEKDFFLRMDEKYIAKNAGYVRQAEKTAWKTSEDMQEGSSAIKEQQIQTRAGPLWCCPRLLCHCTP
ncbi:MAG: hypothetical protein KAR83_07795 [Thermodesulfovibrionales bacterium]|nr:hypothetical protein [Thermodesulfovibrionales bacterium]